MIASEADFAVKILSSFSIVAFRRFAFFGSGSGQWIFFRATTGKEGGGRVGERSASISLSLSPSPGRLCRSPTAAAGPRPPSHRASGGRTWLGEFREFRGFGFGGRKTTSGSRSGWLIRVVVRDAVRDAVRWGVAAGGAPREKLRKCFPAERSGKT